MKRRIPGYGLIAAAAFFAPLLGGQISLDVPVPLGDSLPELITSLHSGPQAAHLAWGLLGLLILGSITLALVNKKVSPVPMTPISWSLGLLLACLGFSVLISGYRSVSLATFSSWVLAIAAFFATVTLAGRQRGPRAICIAFVAGCAYVSARGIWEYLIQPDPTWRIFANWFHPNALAALLAMALPVALAFAASEDLPETLMGLLTTAMIAPALLLTQSRGGYLFAAVGVLVFGVLMLVWSKAAKIAMLRLIKLGIAGVAAAIVMFGIIRSPAPTDVSPAEPDSALVQPSFVLVRQVNEPRAASPLSRVAQSDTAQEQSSGFRRLLWRTAIDLMKENPAGWGLNTFRFHSPRPGLTTQTALAHNTYLQLGVEASVLAPLLLIVAGTLILIFSTFGARSMPVETGLLRAGVLGAVVAIAGHNLVDSDFYHFGILLPLFVLLGVLVQLGATGGAPEVLRAKTRVLLPILPLVAVVALIHLGLVDVTLSRTIASLNSGEVDKAFDSVRSLESTAPWDGRVTYLAASFIRDPRERSVKVDEANSKMPNTRFLRTSARFWQEAGEVNLALERYTSALAIDPNNLPTLSAKMHLERDNELPWQTTALRLVEVQSKPYFQVRSIPEIVPTEIAEARVYLAVEQSGVAAVALLRPAVETYLSFARDTVPRVVQMDAAFPGGRYGDDTLTSVRAKLGAGMEASRRLADFYRNVGDDAGVGWAEDAADKLASDLAALD